MPDGLTHYKFYKKGYFLALPLSIVVSCSNFPLGFGILCGYTLGRYVSPDWDIMGCTGDEGRMVNELPIIGHVMFGISSSYGSAHRRLHRHPIWTHSPFLSTGIRLVWLMTLPLGLLHYFGILPVGEGWNWFWLGVWLGLSIADGIHIILDNKFGGE